MRSCPFIGFNVAGELFTDAGTKHFDRDVLAFGRAGTVHLRNGRCAYRLRVDIIKQRRRWLIKAAVNLSIDLVKGRGW